MCMKKYFYLGKNSSYDVRIYGLEKIKIPEEGEFIISYSNKVINLLKITN